ncbi:MAG TPA: hypothetical protein VFK05_08790 [Polyangiaceae bacterium]|nr:hypothetical protein [Polyangiaceae bacterium]
MSELRSWFLRNVLEAAERQLGAPAMAGLRARLPPRLAAHASLERLRASTALDCVPLDEGAEILLSLDSHLGDASGKLLESLGIDLASRVLSQDNSLRSAGDLAGTVARLQTFLEHPFVGVPLSFELRRNPTGFALSVGVTGHSRATRALRHLALGAIIAAERFAREVGAESLKLSVENLADRSYISARYLAAEAKTVEKVPPPSRRPAVVRAPAASLSAEVERILRTSAPGPRPAEEDPQPPESMTLRVASAVLPVRGPASKR